jgi:hypothetical protein
MCTHVLLAAVSAVPGEHDILAHNPTAGLLRPAFAIVKDTTTRQVILCVRGTHSRQDIFTSLTGELQLAGNVWHLCLQERRVPLCSHLAKNTQSEVIPSKSSAKLLLAGSA